jgi:hypothetical protein
VACVRQVEGAPSGVEVCLAHVPRQSAEGDARFAPRGGLARATRMDAAVSCADASPRGRCAARALDAAAAPGSGRGGQGLVVASRGGQEPGGVTRGFPGAAHELQGVMRQGDSAVLGTLAAGDVERVAWALASTHLQGQRCVPAQPAAGDGGAGDTRGQGSGGMEKTPDCFQAEQSRESVCRRGAHEVAGFPVAPKDVVGEASETTGTETPGTGRESIAIFSVKKVWPECLCRDEGRRWARALSQQAYLSDRGLLRTFACATELQGGDHWLAQ